MRRKILATAIASAVFGLSALAGTAAYAEEIDSYTPTTPSEPSLAGTTSDVECASDVPWIKYTVKLTDPDNVSTSNEAFLRISGSGESVDLPLGTLVDGTVSGSILWPGAAIDADGNAAGWPGWELVDGVWQQTTGNYAWTRGDIVATVHVNPEAVVPLSYPEATTDCANPESVSSSGGSAGGAAASGTATAAAPGLAVTGSTISWAVAGIGVGALAVGGALLAVRRRRVHD